MDTYGLGGMEGISELVEGGMIMTNMVKSTIMDISLFMIAIILIVISLVLLLNFMEAIGLITSILAIICLTVICMHVSDIIFPDDGVNTCP